MPLLEAYLRDLSEIRATGAAVAETSYYPALSTLFNSAGRALRPQVRCVVNPANRGAGIPDVGLFTADQLQKADDEPLPGQLPARGVVEVKGTAADAWAVAASAQVRKYWQKYRQVLVTNYRDFVLVGEDAEGQQTILETYSLAANEAAFWQAAALAPATAAAQSERFAEFVKRVMLHAAPLTTPQDVAWLLASYARSLGGDRSFLW